ncbi:MAG: hypothetical protein ACR2OR_05855 [Hyphomicrobiales bacterium]
MLSQLSKSSRNTAAIARTLVLAAIPAFTLIAVVPAHATIGLELDHAQKIPGNLPFQTIELPCTYQPAGENGSPGYVQIFNATPYALAGGLPVNYRVSGSGEEFTFHLPNRSTPFDQARVNHKNTVNGTCVAWTFVR